MDSSFVTIKNNYITASIAKEMYGNTFTCDMVIKCGSELLEFYCHRVILACASDFLYAALSEAVPGNLPVIILPDIEPRTLRQILYYVYNGEIQLGPADYDEFIAGCKLLQITSMLSMKAADNEFEMETDEMQETNSTQKIDDSNVKNESRETGTTGKENELILDICKNEKAGSSKDSEMKKVQPIPRRNELPKGSTIQKQLVIDTHEKGDEFLKRAKKSIRCVYGHFEEKPSESIDKVINNTKLVLDGNKLMGVDHVCGFCGKTYRIGRNQMRYHWNTQNLKNHIVNVHKFVYKK